MALLTAILLALFVLPAPWGIALVAAAIVVEVGETWFWFRWSRRRRAVTGAEGLIGRRAVVVEACRPEGRVRVHGELWQARSRRGADVGERVRVRAVDRLVLEVD